MEDLYNELYFHQYCKTCTYADYGEDDDPCYDCLADPANVYSHKPIKKKKKGELTDEKA